MSISDGVVEIELLGSAGSHKEIWNTGCIFIDVGSSSLKLTGCWTVVNCKRSHAIEFFFFWVGLVVKF